MWVRKLYLVQDFPDNYVDSSFLGALRRNERVIEHSFAEVRRDVLVVVHTLTTVVAFDLLFTHALAGTLSTAALAAANAVALAVATLAVAALGSATLAARAARTLALLAAAVLLVTPVLRTLAATIADDTVYALAACLQLVHLYAADYSHVAPESSSSSSSSSSSTTTTLTTSSAAASSSSSSSSPSWSHDLSPAPVSLNAAIFAAVALASRLRSLPLVALVCTLAIVLFSLLPLCVRRVRDEHPRVYVGVCVLSVLSTAAALHASTPTLVARSALVAFVGAVCFLLFGFPALLVYAQQFKSTINGPWDEARPRGAAAVWCPAG